MDTVFSPSGTPDVSILIAAWNAEATLERAAKSALAQTAAVEVLIVDDASTDGTGHVAVALAKRDGRVRVFRQPDNCGPAAARNRALSEARGDWVTALDADDVMEPGRLSDLLRIAREEGADFVADDLYKVREVRPGARRRRLVSDAPIGRRAVRPEEFVAGNLVSRHGGRREYGFLKPLMSRNFLRRHGLRYPDLRLGEDYVLYAEALIHGARFVLTDPAGYLAVQRDGSLSHDHPTAAHEALIGADRALLALPGLDRATRRALRAHLVEEHKKWTWRRMIDAVRASSPRAALACFWAPPAVIADLGVRLLREASRRTVARTRSQ